MILEKICDQVFIVGGDLEYNEIIKGFFKQKKIQVFIYKDSNQALLELNDKVVSGSIILVGKLPLNNSIPNLIKIIKEKYFNVSIVLLHISKEELKSLKDIECHFDKVISQTMSLSDLHKMINEMFNFQRELDVSRFQPKIVLPSLNKENTIVGKNHLFVNALNIAKKVALSNANILLSGESGTGKEIFARFIHSESRQKNGPFIAFNCSAIPENLMESELFGHAKGAFTGAFEKRIGLFEEAQEGTIFLDEIGDLSLSLQAKLLRVLQEKKIKRVGENLLIPINCRIISATNKDLLSEIRDHHFREDLFFRLEVIPIFIPPLRERPEDIMLLADLFMQKFSVENGSPAKGFSKEAEKYIKEQMWRGNVRELENAVAKAVILCETKEIPVELMITRASSFERENIDYSKFDGYLPFIVHCPEQLPSLEFVVNKYIEFAVMRTGGARDCAAREIGIDRKTLYKRMKPRICV